MKRHPALEPFSRDHNDGLILARALQLGRDGALEAARKAWDDELKDHFAEEEALLGPLMDQDQRARMGDDHRRIEQLIAAPAPSLEELGTLLHDHIRWEERELFPWIEASASEELLTTLADATGAMEERRWEHDSRRKELVSRRAR